ncbi:MAG: ribonuclease P protein component [Candidatus Spechtbacterales bacterium]
MIPQKHRLDSKSFEDTFRKGKSFKSTSFFVKVVKNSTKNTRVGVGITKKLTKKAVKRNYYKRVLRHLIKSVLESTTPGYDVVIIANENMRGQKFDKLQKEMYELFRKTGIINN